jgi:hypothetical protein
VWAETGTVPVRQAQPVAACDGQLAVALADPVWRFRHGDAVVPDAGLPKLAGYVLLSTPCAYSMLVLHDSRGVVEVKSCSTSIQPP